MTSVLTLPAKVKAAVLRPVLSIVIVIASGCGTATQPTSAPSGSATLPSALTSPSASVAVADTSRPAASACDPADRTSVHQAPELEALLPDSVSGRTLAKWSLRGRCWVDITVNRSPAEIDALLDEFDAADPANKIALENLTFAVAGRSDTVKDPPFFVFAAARPRHEEEIALALFLLFGGAQFHDLSKLGDLTGYDEQKIGGKGVAVGTVDMLKQSEHQRGRPYLYQNDDYMFLVVTDDDAWAADAIAQLPD